MTTDVTAPAPAKPTAPPKPASASKSKAAQPDPRTTLTVPAKPAAVTAANVAAIGGTAAAAAGPVGWAVAAAVAAAGGGFYVARRVVRRSRAETARTATVIGGGSGLGRLGGGSAGRSRGTGVGGLGRGARAGTSAPGSSAGRAVAGRRWPSLGRSRGQARTSRGGGTTGGRDAGGRRGALGQIGRGLGAVGRGAAGPARAAWKAAKTRRANTKAARAAGTKGPGMVARARRLMHRNVLGKPATAKPDAGKRTTAGADGAAKRPPRRTGTTIRRAPDPTVGADQTQRGPVPKPDRRSTERKPTMSGNGNTNGGPQPSSHFWRSAQQLHGAAAKFEPRGMIEVRNECFELPHALGEIAAALRVRAQAVTKQPLQPALAAAIMQIAACVDTAAQASRQLGPAFDNLHPTEVARILKPRPNEQAWDVSNNRG